MCDLQPLPSLPAFPFDLSERPDGDPLSTVPRSSVPPDVTLPEWARTKGGVYRSRRFDVAPSPTTLDHHPAPPRSGNTQSSQFSLNTALYRCNLRSPIVGVRRWHSAVTRRQIHQSPPARAEGTPSMAASLPTEDAYAVLGVSRAASDEQIRGAFLSKAIKYHPTAARESSDPGLDRAVAAELFRRSAEAFTLIRDDIHRRAYNLSLQSAPTQGSSLTLHAPPFTPRQRDSSMDRAPSRQQREGSTSRARRYTVSASPAPSNLSLSSERSERPIWGANLPPTLQSEVEEADPMHIFNEEMAKLKTRAREEARQPATFPSVGGDSQRRADVSPSKSSTSSTGLPPLPVSLSTATSALLASPESTSADSTSTSNSEVSSQSGTPSLESSIAGAPGKQPRQRGRKVSFSAQVMAKEELKQRREVAKIEHDDGRTDTIDTVTTVRSPASGTVADPSLDVTTVTSMYNSADGTRSLAAWSRSVSAALPGPAARAGQLPTNQPWKPPMPHPLDADLAAGNARNRDTSPISWALEDPDVAPWSTLQVEDPVDIPAFLGLTRPENLRLDLSRIPANSSQPSGTRSRSGSRSRVETPTTPRRRRNSISGTTPTLSNYPKGDSSTSFSNRALYDTPTATPRISDRALPPDAGRNQLQVRTSPRESNRGGRPQPLRRRSSISDMEKHMAQAQTAARPPLLSADDGSSATIRPSQSNDPPPLRGLPSPPQRNIDDASPFSSATSDASQVSAAAKPLKSALKKTKRQSRIDDLLAAPPQPSAPAVVTSPRSRPVDRDAGVAKLAAFLEQIDPHGSFDGPMATTLYNNGVTSADALLAMDEDELRHFLSKLEKRREQGLEGSLTPYQESTLPRRLQMWRARQRGEPVPPSPLISF